MAIAFQLTPGQPITVTAVSTQPLSEAVDVSEFDILDLMSSVAAMTASTVTIKIITGMQKQSEDGWVTAVEFSAATVVGSELKTKTNGFLRYIRWTVTAITGGSATFYIRGMGRSYCRHG